MNYQARQGLAFNKDNKPNFLKRLGQPVQTSAPDEKTLEKQKSKTEGLDEAPQIANVDSGISAREVADFMGLGTDKVDTNAPDPAKAVPELRPGPAAQKSTGESIVSVGRSKDRKRKPDKNEKGERQSKKVKNKKLLSFDEDE